MGDNIKKPDHYCEGRKYEPKDVIRDWGLNFNLGSAVKYISRAGRKGDMVEDLQKAKQFLQFEIEAVENEEERESREAFYKSIDALDECKARLSDKDKMEQEDTAKVKKRFVDLNTGEDLWLKQEESDTFTISFKVEED